MLSGYLSVLEAIVWVCIYHDVFLSRYAAGLCLGLPEESVVQVGTENVNMRVIKSQLKTKHEEDLNIGFDNESKFSTLPSYIMFGSILKQFITWSCGAVDTVTQNEISCYGACLTTAEFSTRFTSPSSKYRSLPGTIRTNMVKTEIRNPHTGVVPKIQPTESPEMEYTIYLENSNVPTGKKLECFSWLNFAWSNSACRTLRIQEDGSSMYQKCLCPVPGYVMYVTLFIIYLG